MSTDKLLELVTEVELTYLPEWLAHKLVLTTSEDKSYYFMIEPDKLSKIKEEKENE